MLMSGVLALPGCGGSSNNGTADPTPAASPADAEPVTLAIDFGDRTRRFEGIGWTEGMTVLDVMQAAEDADGALDFDSTGRGETALVTAIDGQRNEGAGRSAQNWLYWVDGAFASRSFAVATVEPGDTVTWRFAPYDAGDENEDTR